MHWYVSPTWSYTLSWTPTQPALPCLSPARMPPSRSSVPSTGLCPRPSCLRGDTRATAPPPPKVWMMSQQSLISCMSSLCTCTVQGALLEKTFLKEPRATLGRVTHSFSLSLALVRTGWLCCTRDRSIRPPRSSWTPLVMLAALICPVLL